MTEITHNGKEWSNASEDQVALSAYNPAWPQLYQAEIAAIASLLPHGLHAQFEHFGSTSIPDLAAKPIIDILLILDDRTQWQALITPLQSLGYHYWSDNPRQDRMFFVKGMPPFGTGRTHHVHVRTNADAQKELLFRDYLRQNKEELARYEALKSQLAQQHATDREAYTSGKDAYIAGVLSTLKNG